MVEYPDSSERLRNLQSKSEKDYGDWDKVPVGKSFGLPASAGNLKKLRTQASKYGKTLGKKFRVIDWGDQGFEIGRLPDPEPQEQGPAPWLSNTVDAKEPESHG
jgi:hypothetical protein